MAGGHALVYATIPCTLFVAIVDLVVFDQRVPVEVEIDSLVCLAHVVAFVVSFGVEPSGLLGLRWQAKLPFSGDESAGGLSSDAA